jgi:hypothetical protein
MTVEKLERPIDIQLRACPELSQLEPPADQVVASRRETATSDAIELELVLRSDVAGVIESGMCTAPATTLGIAGQRVVLLDAPDGGAPVQLPRITEKEFKVTRKKERTKAFWSSYRMDTEKVIKDCFVSDWSRVKVGRLIKDEELIAVQKIVENTYRRILSIYKYMSAVGVSGESGSCFGVSQIEASDAWVSLGLVDGETTKISDADRLMIAAKVIPPSMKNNGVVVRSDTVLVRHQFLEMLLRIAQQRFIQSGVCTSMVDAVGRVLASMEKMGDTRVTETNSFMDAFHTESVDDVCMAHADLLQAVSDRFSGRITPPGLPRFMSLCEFQDFLEVTDAYDSEFFPRKSGFAFRLGMMTQVEESYSTRFQEMTLAEFYHAIGAVVFLRADFERSRMADLCEKFISCNIARSVPRAGKH